MASVEFEHVEKIYPNGFRAITDLNLHVADGELMVFVGPSGCGKSTLLRLLAGLEEISRGRILIGERLANRLTPQARNIAMVFQDYALYPNMTVRGNLEFPLRMRKLPKMEIRRRAERVAAMLGLEELLERLPRQLSGGQRQRVAMGRALVREPAVFLLDEPLSNLDARLRVQVRAEIGDLQKRTGTTMIYVTHDQVEAMTLAQRMIVMNAGRAEQIGTPMEVYQNPASVFVAGFIGSPAMNFLDGKGDGAGRIVLDGGGSVAIPGKIEAGRRVTVGIRPEHLTPCKPNEANLVGSVEVVEALGADTLIHVTIAGRSIIARLAQGAHAEIGEPIALAAARDKIYLFDADSGARLAT
ncbi:MAG TPA: sn-glycerol-3-phosphate ABC transporter ATP-binding protein UgpC [Aggregatilineales bacterium]|nr:sn-glycerol-3-phosphate ABC transporter ATP-binding protein UgpC [Aggregatilineales bacterium]